MKPKFSQIVLIFMCISCEGDVISPDTFELGHRLNPDGYVKLMLTVVKLWLERGLTTHMEGHKIRILSTLLENY